MLSGRLSGRESWKAHYSDKTANLLREESGCSLYGR